MKLPKINISEKAITKIAQQYKILELYLFGSVLRDDFNNNSDIDILVKFAEGSKYSLFELLEIKEKFENLFHRNTDIVELDGLKNPFRKKVILSTARKIYAAH